MSEPLQWITGSTEKGSDGLLYKAPYVTRQPQSRDGAEGFPLPLYCIRPQQTGGSHFSVPSVRQASSPNVLQFFFLPCVYLISSGVPLTPPLAPSFHPRSRPALLSAHSCFSLCVRSCLYLPVSDEALVSSPYP